MCNEEQEDRFGVNGEQREAQRRSFAYGNTSIENDRVTRKTVDEEAEKLRQQKGDEWQTVGGIYRDDTDQVSVVVGTADQQVVLRLACRSGDGGRVIEFLPLTEEEADKLIWYIEKAQKFPRAKRAQELHAAITEGNTAICTLLAAQAEALLKRVTSEKSASTHTERWSCLGYFVTWSDVEPRCYEIYSKLDARLFDPAKFYCRRYALATCKTVAEVDAWIAANPAMSKCVECLSHVSDLVGHMNVYCRNCKRFGKPESDYTVISGKVIWK